MSKINSKAKGSGFEREIAKKISLWLTNNQRDDTVWRSISSGSFATNKKKKGEISKHSVGDLMSVSEESKLFFDIFNIECKNYKEVDLYHIFTDNCIIIEWYEKLYNDCLFNYKQNKNNYFKNPMIIYKQKYKPILCVINEHIYNIINNYSSYKIYSIKFDTTIEKLNIFKFDDLLSINIDTFLNCINKEGIIKNG